MIFWEYQLLIFKGFELWEKFKGELVDMKSIILFIEEDIKEGEIIK